jgi:hypothetical protein
MVYDYGEVFVAFKSRGYAFPASNSSIQNGQYPGFYTFGEELDDCRLNPEETSRIRLNMTMNDFVEVLADLKGRGHPLLATTVLRIGMFTTYSSGSISGLLN